MTITPGTSTVLHQIHLQDETNIQTVTWTNISQTDRTQGVSDSICLKNNLCFEVSSFMRLSRQPNFSERQTPNKCVFNLPRLLSLLAPSSVTMKAAALQQQHGVANSHELCFAQEPASILHDLFYNDSIKRPLSEAYRFCAHSRLRDRLVNLSANSRRQIIELGTI